MDTEKFLLNNFHPRFFILHSSFHTKEATERFKISKIRKRKKKFILNALQGGYLGGRKSNIFSRSVQRTTTAGKEHTRENIKRDMLQPLKDISRVCLLQRE
jgi:hypothetical protein